MNWLAHIYLSEPSIEFQLGNLLADVVRRPQRDQFGDAFVRGSERHRVIDAYTDAHDIVRRSRSRICPAYRRFSGVLVDIFYDHLLASEWARYAPTSLDVFTRDFYRAAKRCPIELPPDAQRTITVIRRHDLLGSYATIDGVTTALRRLSLRLAARWHKDFALEKSIDDLRTHESAFRADFAEFFPALQTHVMQ